LLPTHPLRETLPVPRSDKIKTSPDTKWTLRLARESDIPALEILIPLSVRTLQAARYTNFSLRLHYSAEAGKQGHAETIPPEPA
jgi:hypothetical protein